MPPDMTGVQPEIPLARMPQQEGVWVPKDDWTGTIDRTERRKLQNRLNQRAYRFRKKLHRELEGQSQPDRHALVVPPPSISVAPLDRDDRGFVCPNAPPEIFHMMQRFKSIMLSNYALNSPNGDQLISLSKFNIQLAIIDNIHSMGMTMQWLERDDAVSIFNLSQPGGLIPELESSIPPSLRPTACQRRISHHPWLDFFPFPNLRDNLITVQDEIDDEDLCHDLMAFWDTRNTGATLLVWGSSWEPTNWEVTPGFLKKWGYLLRGCGELLKSTNYWRTKRGEKPIIWSSI